VARGPERQHRAFIELGLEVAQTERNDGAGARAQRASHEDPLQIAAGDDRAEHSARRGADGGALEDAALVRRQPRLRLDHFRREREAPVADPEAIAVGADRGGVAGPRGRVDARDDAADHRAGRDDGPAIRGHEGRDHRRSEALADLGAPRVQRFVEPHVHDRAAGDEVGAAERRRLHGGTRLDLGAAAGAEREDRGDGERGDPAHAIHLHPWFPSEDTMSQRGGGASCGPAAETDVHCAVRRNVPRAVNSRRWILSRGAAAGAATVSILRSRWEEPMAGEPDVSGKVVLITGASPGLGKAAAETVARGGARVALCARGEADVAAVAGSLVASGAEVVWRAADVRDERAINELVQAAEGRWGPVNVLINNAAILGELVPLAQYPIPTWREVLDVNVTGALIAIQAVLPGMRSAGNGSIINVTSSVGNVARANRGAYAISKWAIEALTYNLALEERDAGIRVDAVAPGAMRTPVRHAARPGGGPGRHQQVGDRGADPQPGARGEGRGHPRQRRGSRGNADTHASGGAPRRGSRAAASARRADRRVPVARLRRVGERDRPALQGAGVARAVITCADVSATSGAPPRRRRVASGSTLLHAGRPRTGPCAARTACPGRAVSATVVAHRPMAHQGRPFRPER